MFPLYNFLDLSPWYKVEVHGKSMLSEDLMCSGQLPDFPCSQMVIYRYKGVLDMSWLRFAIEQAILTSQLVPL